MKSFILILSTFIFFLAAKPGIELLLPAFVLQEHCQDVCNTEKNHPEKENGDKNCEGKLCNPFQFCCTAVLIFIDPLSDYLPQPQVFPNNAFLPYISHISCFNVDFWHPPKIV